MDFAWASLSRTASISLGPNLRTDPAPSWWMAGLGGSTSRTRSALTIISMAPSGGVSRAMAAPAAANFAARDATVSTE